MLRRTRTLLIAGIGALALLIPGSVPPVAVAGASSPGNIRPPFPVGQTWYVFQGYSSGTHTGTSQYGVDLTISSSTTATSGRTVTAPAAGTIAYWQPEYGNLCVNTAGGRSYTLTHINASKTSGSVSVGESLGTVAAAGQRANNNVAHLHFEFWSGPGCYNQSSPLPLDAAHGLRMCGAPDMTPSGPDAWNNGVWSGTAITAASCGATGVSPQGAFDSLSVPAAGKVRVRGWAFDKDKPTTPVTVQVYVGGPKGSGERHTVTANASRPDVASAHPGVGNNHGFDATVTTSRYGFQPVYVYASNVSGTGGSEKLIATRSTWIAATPYVGTHWEDVGRKRLRRVSLGPTGKLWGVNKAGAVFEYTGGGHWKRRGSGFKDVAVGMPGDAATGGPQVYALKRNGAVRRWRIDHWEPVAGRLAEIDFGPDGGRYGGHLWGVTPSGEVLEYEGGGEWARRGRGFAEIAVGTPVDVATGGPRIYALKESGQVRRWRTDHWEEVAGRFARIDFGPNGDLWGVTASHELWQYVGSGQWKRRGNDFVDVAVGMPGDGIDSPRVYAIKSNGLVRRWRR